MQAASPPPHRTNGASNCQCTPLSTGHCTLGAASSSPLGVGGGLRQLLSPELRAADSQPTPSHMGQPSGERGEAHSIGKEERGPGIGRGLAAVLLKFRMLVPILGSGCLK